MSGSEVVCLEDSGKIERLAAVLRERACPARDPMAQRAFFDGLMTEMPLADEVDIAPVEAYGVACEWLLPAVCAPGRAILYLHGGGYVMGSPATARRLAARVGAVTGARVLSVGYRVAPEHPYPAAVQDALAAYSWLTNGPAEPSGVVVAGDSAGAGLAIATLLAARDAWLPMPAAAVCLSPWADLTLSGRSLEENAANDPQVELWQLASWAQLYLGDHDPYDPLVSPAFGDLAGLPPMLVHAGTAELLADDAALLASAARRAGVEVTLELYERMIHVWHGFFPGLPEATASLERVARWLEDHWPDALDLSTAPAVTQSSPAATRVKGRT